MMNDEHSLDPQPGPVIPFRRSGKYGWTLGNRPTRLAREIIETETGETVFIDRDPVTWETITEDAA